MRKTECLKKSDELIDRMLKIIRQNTRKALKSGAINLRSYDNNYRLPLILVNAATQSAAGMFRPHDEEALEEVHNLGAFI